MTLAEQTSLQDALYQIGKESAAGILEIYQKQFKVQHKEDGSFVTSADLLAHEIISTGLKQLQPSLPVLSEESADVAYSERKQWGSYWLVDPLDGTREFVHRRDDFTINVALIENHTPVLGMVYVPVGDLCYLAAKQQGAYCVRDGEKQTLCVKTEPSGVPTIAVSFSHTGEKTQMFLDSLKDHRLTRRGSMVKVCLIAEAKADMYPRFGNTYEWDTAAGQCILEEAGGHLTDWRGQALEYNKKDSLLNPPFVAYAPSAAAHIDFSRWQDVGE